MQAYKSNRIKFFLSGIKSGSPPGTIFPEGEPRCSVSRVSSLAETYPQLSLRCHQSYLVNPSYIRSIRRFQLTLTNGVTLPIPEKRYTAFREEAARLLKSGLSNDSGA